jgi:hypothetical protein
MIVRQPRYTYSLILEVSLSYAVALLTAQLRLEAARAAH